MRLKPRIRVVLLLVNLVLLALPLGGLWLLRIYESALVRQTETELLAQGAIIAAGYRHAWGGRTEEDGTLAPRFAVLDLARDAILPPPPDAVAAAGAAPQAIAAGQAVAPLLREARRSNLAAARVMDARGIVVASSSGELGQGLGGMEEVALALAGQGAARLRARADVVPAGLASISRPAPFRVFVTLPVQEEGRVIGAVLLSRTPASIGQTLYGKRWELGGLALALAAAAAGFAAFTAYTVSRPIAEVAAQAKAVAAGARVAMRRPRRSAVRETDELFAAIAAMAATLERRADYIGEFATAVSHEFKTPLAALRGALELLQDHAASMTEAERQGFLAQSTEDVERLDRLVRRLLELARAEAPRPAAGQAMLRATLEAAAQGLPVALLGEEMAVAMAPDALRGVFTILFENMRQHAGPGASAEVAWHAEAGRLVLRVADDGRGISAANAGRVFDRFFTTARESGGTGLGLAIARGHVEAAGGTLRLVAASRGASFELRLPLSGSPPPPPPAVPVPPRLG